MVPEGAICVSVFVRMWNSSRTKASQSWKSTLTRCQQLGGFRIFFSLMPETTREVGIEGSTLLQNGCQVLLEHETLISPAWSVLFMGCSWSLYFAQSVTETIASRAPALDGLSPLHDKSRELFLGRRKGVQAYYVYVDNLGVIAKTQQEADAVLNQWKDLFADSGLTLHKSELAQKIKSLGIELDGLSVCVASAVRDSGLCDEPWTRFCDAEK